MKRTVLKTFIIVFLLFPAVTCFSTLNAQDKAYEFKDFESYKKSFRLPASKSKKNTFHQLKNTEQKEDTEPEKVETVKATTFALTSSSPQAVPCGEEFTMYGFFHSQRTADSIKGVSISNNKGYLSELPYSEWTDRKIKVRVPYGMKAGIYGVYIRERSVQYEGDRPPDRVSEKKLLIIQESRTPNLHFPRVGGATQTRIGKNYKTPSIITSNLSQMKEFGYKIGKLNINSSDVYNLGNGRIRLPIKVGVRELNGKTVRFKLKFYVNNRLNTTKDVKLGANLTAHCYVNLDISNPGNKISIQTHITDIAGGGDPNLTDNKTLDNINYNP